MKSQVEKNYRRLPIGAELYPSGGAHFRVWAPASSRVWVLLEDTVSEDHYQRKAELQKEEQGYFSGFVQEAKKDSYYRYQLDQGAFPDPASRFQPQGPHGPSQLIDASDFHWTDHDWKGVPLERHVIYEMHIGTFTQEGTWAAVTKQLKELADLGITLIEIMPVADFTGRYGWGYDGVNLFAPTRLYGKPDEFRTFVDHSHRCGIGVILDVVYNHLGPDGNYLAQFSPDYFSHFHKCEWGEALNFDAENHESVREFFISNAGYWIDEFHLDGLRLDATQQIFDRSKNHIVADIVRSARKAAKGRSIYIVGENESQETRLVRPLSQNGYDLDAVWNDDFHHSSIVALTGCNEAYYTDYTGSAQEFISSIKWGYLYQGQLYKWQKKRRGTPALDLAPSNFVIFIQNHDQIANSLWGRRIHTLTSMGRLRTITALLLLGPNTPMLFQGQEFAASSPFLYFADHNEELAAIVAKARAEYLAQFPSIASPEATAVLSDPKEESTFKCCKLNFKDREQHVEIYRLHRDLISLRKKDPLLGSAKHGNYDGAVLAKSAFILRFFGKQQNDRLLLINFDAALHLNPAPEPLLAPVQDHEWEVLWSSEDPQYGGGGTPAIESEENWYIPAQSAIVMIPKPKKHESEIHS